MKLKILLIAPPHINIAEPFRTALEKNGFAVWPDGQVKRLVLGSTVQGVDYLYNSRDWLTQINSHFLLAGKDPGNDSTTVTKDRFGEIIGYNKQKYIASDAQFSSGPSGYAPQ